MPSADSVWGNVLLAHGFQRFAIKSDCPDCYTVEEFAYDHPEGVYVLGVGGHVLTVAFGRYLDSWDSGNEVVIFYYKRKED